MSVPRSRILDLMKVRARIFNTVFNPSGARLGNKILRARLKGPALSSYYPRRIATFQDMQKAYPEWQMYDDKEEDRLEHIQVLKAKGKGAPKKRRTAAESKKLTRKKRK